MLNVYLYLNMVKKNKQKKKISSTYAYKIKCI